MAKSNYNCSEQELYTICETAWTSCNQYLNRFSAFKPKYKQELIDDRLAAINAARELPDEQQRNEKYESTNVLLKKEARIACDKWQLLKRYIADAYEQDLHKSKWEAAGFNYYEKAANNNWDSVKGLMTSGLTFINNNLGELTANDNMPPAFPAQFENAKTDFEKRHQTFIQAEEESSTGQETKMNANNSIHSDLMSMLLDGQEIFKNEESICKQFVFADLLYLASGSGTAGIKGVVVVQLTETPIQGAKISIDNANKNTLSAPDGRYEINQVASGKYDISCVAAGFEPQKILGFEIKVGTVSTLNFKLNPSV